MGRGVRTGAAVRKSNMRALRAKVGGASAGRECAMRKAVRRAMWGAPLGGGAWWRERPC